MARKKVSEFIAKKILYKHLGLPYRGVSLDLTKNTKEKCEGLDSSVTYVIKVDEGVKKRMKNGLIALNKKPKELFAEAQTLQKKGYTHFIIEPFLPYKQEAERYLSLSLIRDGFAILYSEKGGIDIEDNQESIHRYTEKDVVTIADKKIAAIVPSLLDAMKKYHFSFLEINSLVVANEQLYLLDVAAEVDSAGEFFVHNAWSSDDFRNGAVQKKTDEEEIVALLSQKSQASFALTVLNPDGEIFMLLSGGGASIVLADEVYNLGFGDQLANYGEYSGNPNAEEVALYTTQIVQLLLKSKAKKKVLIIAGGVANFTDIRITFAGIIKALDAVKKELQKQQVKIYVRRGGPHQEEGLAKMELFLQENNLLGFVGNQKTSLPYIVKKAMSLQSEVKSQNSKVKIAS